MYMPGYTDQTIHKQSVSSCGSILLGELIAIKMVINEIQNQAEKRELNNLKKVHYFLGQSVCKLVIYLLDGRLKCIGQVYRG